MGRHYTGGVGLDRKAASSTARRRATYGAMSALAGKPGAAAVAVLRRRTRIRVQPPSDLCASRPLQGHRLR